MTRQPPPVRKFLQARLDMGGSATSQEAKDLVGHLRDQTVLPPLTSQQRRPSTLPAIERAIAATVAGLSLAKGDGWLTRPLSPDSFSGEAVSRVQFLKVLKALEAQGLVEVAKGFHDRSGYVARGSVSRIRLAEAGWELQEAFGISRGDVGLHYATEDIEMAES